MTRESRESAAELTAAERDLTRAEPRQPVVGRLAPSPTGHLHLGHARSFLLAWWSARSRGGRVLLRLEDLDAERVRRGMAEATLEDLAWLGFDWDGDPILQSTRAADHAVALARLVASGLVYPCVCTRRELAEAASAPNRGASVDAYPGTCRDRFASLTEAESVTGRTAALRFRTPVGVVQFRDRLHGEQSFDVAAEVGDFPVTRRDGTIAYQLAVVVDDAVSAVTDVVRGDDLLASTARQLLLQRALGLAPPSWLHVPLVEDHTGRRLAKREDDVSLAALRAAGVTSSSIVTWSAVSAGLPRSSTARSAQEWLEEYAESALCHAPTRLPPPPALPF
jgi:glutamyl-tRNA synthetase